MIALLDDDDRVELADALIEGLQARHRRGESPSPRVLAFAQELAAKRGQSAATGGQRAGVGAGAGDTAGMQTLSLSEAARHLRLSPRTVRRRVAEGRLTARRDGRRLLFARADLDAYLGGLDAA